MDISTYINVICIVRGKYYRKYICLPPLSSPFPLPLPLPPPSPPPPVIFANWGGGDFRIETSHLVIIDSEKEYNNN